MRWFFKELRDECDSEGIIASKTGLSTLSSRILLSKGFKADADLEKFLNPSLSMLSDPFDIDGVEKAARRILSAARSNEKICVYGDYDADGITAASILLRLFKSGNLDCFAYIPNRFDEGYGINLDAVNEILSSGCTLIISVDCGIKAFEPAGYLKEKKVDLIITDHHEPADSVPESYCIINPKVQYKTGDMRNLSGAGIAFKLAHGIVKLARTGNDTFSGFDLKELLDLTAVGTIADIVPLVGENRIFAKNGLARIRHSNNEGLRSLVKVLSLKPPFRTYDVSFRLGPVINAAGRIEDANKCVELLTSKDTDSTEKIAKTLVLHNVSRQNTEAGIISSAVKKIEKLKDKNRLNKLIMLEDRDWSTGVIGIAASKLARIYNRPVIIFGFEKGIWKGSGRSVEKFNLIEGIEKFAGLIDSYGGHEMAAGLSIRPENYEAFRAAFTAHMNEVIKEDDLIPVLNISARAHFREIDSAFLSELLRMEPFGQGNPEPVLATFDAEVGNTPQVVGGKHLKFNVSKDGYALSCIAFDKAEEFGGIKKGALLDIAYKVKENNYMNRRQPQLILQDVKLK
ncbi:MAG: single-stranded-DNA-specific exonuclease RecJ [Candidatus Aureabacteria bacterium]|nr:single-stranded-DNA-specific exonuclease RecJ [Candidatus Auribacterota bacterium]